MKRTMYPKPGGFLAILRKKNKCSGTRQYTNYVWCALPAMCDIAKPPESIANLVLLSFKTEASNPEFERRAFWRRPVHGRASCWCIAGISSGGRRTASRVSCLVTWCWGRCSCLASVHLVRTAASHFHWFNCSWIGIERITKKCGKSFAAHTYNFIEHAARRSALLSVQGRHTGGLRELCFIVLHVPPAKGSGSNKAMSERRFVMTVFN